MTHVQPEGFEPAGPALFGDTRLIAAGLLGNPFEPAIPFRAIRPGLPAHAACNRLLVTLTQRVQEGTDRPIWIDKNPDMPDSTRRFIVGDLMGSSNDNEGLGILLCYIPAEMLRIGRSRSALNVVAERTASPSFGSTLGRYLADVLPRLSVEPDLEDLRSEIVDRVRKDAESGAEGLFGPCVTTREDEYTTTEIIVDTEARLPKESWDAEETPDDAEEPDAPGDESADGDPEEDGAAGESAETDARAALVEVLVEYVRENESPVLARALKAYFDHGLFAFSQELKITKAPRKTLAAICRFASRRFRRVVLFYDRFDGWNQLEFDMRMKIVTGLAQVRWSVQEHATMAIAAKPRECPELEEQFGSGAHVDWSTPELEAFDRSDWARVVELMIDAAKVPSRELSDELKALPTAFVGREFSTPEEFAAEAASAVRGLLG